MTVAAFAPDLMDQSKIRAAGARIVASVAELAGTDADLVIVDLSRPGVLDAVPAIPGRVVGFGRHTEPELLEAARAAGCDDVLVRSVFFKRLPEIIASAR